MYGEGEDRLILNNADPPPPFVAEGLPLRVKAPELQPLLIPE
jgi:hypothetical protein